MTRKQRSRTFGGGTINPHFPNEDAEAGEVGRAWPLNRKSRVKGDVNTRRRRPLRNPRGVLSWTFTPKAQNMQNAFSKQGDISACPCDSPSGEAVCSFPGSDVRGSPQRIRCLSASAAAVLPWALASTRCPRGEAPEPETHPCGEHHPPALTRLSPSACGSGLRPDGASQQVPSSPWALREAADEGWGTAVGEACACPVPAQDAETEAQSRSLLQPELGTPAVCSPRKWSDSKPPGGQLGNQTCPSWETVPQGFQGSEMEVDTSTFYVHYSLNIAVTRRQNIRLLWEVLCHWP